MMKCLWRGYKSYYKLINCSSVSELCVTRKWQVDFFFNKLLCELLTHANDAGKKRLKRGKTDSSNYTEQPCIYLFVSFVPVWETLDFTLSQIYVWLKSDMEVLCNVLNHNEGSQDIEVYTKILLAQWSKNKSIKTALKEALKIQLCRNISELQSMCNYCIDLCLPCLQLVWQHI